MDAKHTSRHLEAVLIDKQIEIILQAVRLGDAQRIGVSLGENMATRLGMSELCFRSCAQASEAFEVYVRAGGCNPTDALHAMRTDGWFNRLSPHLLSMMEGLG